MRTVKEPEVRKSEIVAAALDLFLQNGYEKTTVDRIIGQLGVAKGCFYHHFRSKEEVFGECVDRMTQSLMDAYLRILTGEQPAKQRLLNYVRYNFELVEKNQPMHEAVHAQPFEELHTGVLNESIRQITPVFVQLINEGRAEGDFQVANAEFAAVALLGAFRELHLQYSDARGSELARLKEWTVDLMERMLGASFRSVER